MNSLTAPVLRVGLIGAGRWGANYLRALPATPGVELAAVCDIDAEALARARQVVPSVSAVADLGTLEASLDAVVIATPAATHAAIALRYLDAGKHVLVEKPLSTDVASAVAVTSCAVANDRTLFVGHLTLGHPVLALLRDSFANGAVGAVERIEVIRTSNGARHRRDSPLWSLGPHDVANVLFVSGSTPARVREAWAHDSDESGIELELGSGVLVRMRWSRSSVSTERRLVVHGAAGSLSFDEPSGTLQLSRDGQTRTLAAAPASGLLDWQCAQFVQAIRDRSSATAARALQVVRVLAAAQAKLDRVAPEQKLSAAV